MILGDTLRKTGRNLITGYDGDNVDYNEFIKSSISEISNPLLPITIIASSRFLLPYFR